MEGVRKDTHILHNPLLQLSAPIPENWRMIQYAGDDNENIYYMNMKTGHIQQEHPLDVVYRERVQQEKKLKEQQQKHGQQLRMQNANINQDYMMSGGAGMSGLAAGGAGFAAKQEDPLIKAEIDKNIKEQRKLLEQDYARSI